MKKNIVVLSSVLFFLTLLNPIDAKGTRDQAQALVKKAIAYYQANGKEKAFAEINTNKGMFVNDDLYIFVYDLNGKCVAHGFNSKMIGKDLLDAKDPDGVLFVRERIEIAKTKGSGWQKYKFTNPATYKVEKKVAYVEKVDTYIFGCGAYD